MQTQTIPMPATLVDEAKKYAKSTKRTIPEQVAYWAKIGKAAIDNPDLPVPFIIDIFKAMEEEPIPFER
jgi:hypothetical protein